MVQGLWVRNVGMQRIKDEIFAIIFNNDLSVFSAIR